MSVQKRALILAAASGAAILAAPLPGLAAPSVGVGVVLGSGGITPGLDATVPANQTVSFSGTAVGAGETNGSPVVVDDTCNFSGGSTTPETDGSGAGTATGSCTGTTSVTANVAYTRFGSIVLLNGTGSVNGTPGFLNAACVFVPTSFQPVKSYQLACGELAQDVTPLP